MFVIDWHFVQSSKKAVLFERKFEAGCSALAVTQVTPTNVEEQKANSHLFKMQMPRAHADWKIPKYYEVGKLIGHGTLFDLSSES